MLRIAAFASSVVVSTPTSTQVNTAACVSTSISRRVTMVVTMDVRFSSAVAEPRFYAVLGRRLRGPSPSSSPRSACSALGVRQGAALVAAGAVVGLAAAAASRRVLESFVYGIATGDRLTFVAAPLALVTACGMAGRGCV